MRLKFEYLYAGICAGTKMLEGYKNMTFVAQSLTYSIPKKSFATLLTWRMSISTKFSLVAIRYCMKSHIATPGEKLWN